MNSKYKKYRKRVIFYLSVTILLVSEQVIVKIRYLLSRNSLFSHDLLKVNSQCRDNFNELHFLWNPNIQHV